MKCYIGEVHSGCKYIGMVSAVSIINLKRKASQLCNSYYNVVDTMEVTIYEDDDVIGTVHFTRINIKTPNNEIQRGKWS